MIVRPATPQDMPTLLALGRAYCGESARRWTLDEDQARETVAGLIDSPECLASVCECRGVIVGAVSAVARRHYTREAWGVLDMLYVHPKARRTEAGSLLVAHYLAWCLERGATPVAGLFGGAPGQDVAAVNLFRKAGFAPAGTVMIRE